MVMQTKPSCYCYGIVANSPEASIMLRSIQEDYGLMYSVLHQGRSQSDTSTDKSIFVFCLYDIFVECVISQSGLLLTKWNQHRIRQAQCCG